MKVWPSGELRSAAKSVGLLYAWSAGQFDALQRTLWPSDDDSCVSMLIAAKQGPSHVQLVSAPAATTERKQ